MVWRQLGWGETQLGAVFLDDRRVYFASDWEREIHRLHTLPEAVSAARDAINEHCRYVGTDPTVSPCWPSIGIFASESR